MLYFYDVAVLSIISFTITQIMNYVLTDNMFEMFIISLVINVVALNDIMKNVFIEFDLTNEIVVATVKKN